MEVKFKADEIAGMAVMMNNGTIPFLGLVTILPHGVENVFKWKPSFMFDKVVKQCKEKFEQMGILESYEFTNLLCVMLKSKYQITMSKNDKFTEAIFLGENNTAGIMIFEDDGTYLMKDGLVPKKIVAEFINRAKGEDCDKIYLREFLCKPVPITADDIEEIFNLMYI